MAGRQDRGVNKHGSDTEEESDCCGKCTKEVNDSDDALECEVCEIWFHIKCENIPKMVYTFMQDNEAGKQLSWHCSYCKRGCAKLHKRIKNLYEQQKDMINKHEALTVTVDEMKGCVEVTHEKHGELDNRVGHLEAQSVKVSEVMEKNCVEAQELADRLGSLEAKLVGFEEKLESQKVQWPKLGSGDKATSPHQNLQGQKDNDSVITEIYERKRRENNLVMYGVPESNSVVISERIEHDRKCLIDFLHACGVQVEDKIYEVFRIGSIRPNHYRPLLIRFTDISPKLEIFRNVKNLRGNDAYSGVRVANDYTKQERDHEAALWKEAKNLEAAGKGQHRVIGPPWRRRITKVMDTTRGRIPRPMSLGQREQGQVGPQPPREDLRGLTERSEVVIQREPAEVGLQN